MGTVRFGMEWQVRWGGAWKGAVRCGKERRGKAGTAGVVWCGAVWSGAVRTGKEWQVRLG